jgi:hypothetical protein
VRIPDLLAALDAAVLRGGGTGFGGQVTFGVEVEPDRALWWVADLGPTPATRLLDTFPAGADAGALMSAGEADRLLGLGSPEAPSPAEPHFAVFGDLPLLQKTIDRYLRRRSPVAARLAPGPRTRKELE